MLGVDKHYAHQYDRHGGEYPRSVIALVCSAIVVTVQWCLRWVTTPIEEMEEYLDAQLSNEHFDSRPFKTLKNQIQAREERRLPYEYSILYYTLLYYTILYYTTLYYMTCRAGHARRRTVEVEQIEAKFEICRSAIPGPNEQDHL
mgnify:CR=1 FL=1